MHEPNLVARAHFVKRGGEEERRKGGQETPKTEMLQGTLTPAELGKLQKLLGDREFRTLTSTPRFLLGDGETFVAEVPGEYGVLRVVVSNADNENPFPRSAERIVSWLQHFKAEGAEPIDVSAMDICPSAALQPVNPGIASLQPVPLPGGCVMR